MWAHYVNLNRIDMICTLCDHPLTIMADEYYFLCQSCGAYVKNEVYFISNDEEKSRYEHHNNDVEDINYQNFTSPITNAIIQRQRPQDLGLDYGCGPGPVISEMLKKHGYNVILFDPYFYPEHSYLNQKYDYIFSCEVFEHFKNPKYEIEKLYNLLKPNGYLYIMTHIYEADIPFECWYYRRDPTHVFIYTKKTFEYIAGKYQMSIIKHNKRLVIMSKNELK